MIMRYNSNISHFFYVTVVKSIVSPLHQITGVIQKVLPVLSTETLLHIWLSTEYYGFRPSSTAVDTGVPGV